MLVSAMFPCRVAAASATMGQAFRVEHVRLSSSPISTALLCGVIAINPSTSSAIASSTAARPFATAHGADAGSSRSHRGASRIRACAQPPGAGSHRSDGPRFRAAMPQVAVFDTGFHATLGPPPTFIPAPMSGSTKASAATDSTASAINTLRAAPRKSWAAIRKRLRVDHLPSRQRSFARRHPRRRQHRHHHGLHAARRPHDGHALRHHRSRHHHPSGAPSRLHAPNDWIAC